ncbi:hypothetical protein [Clostridium sp. BL-8]|uniref:hypothetical protein n=1 Tax=Clostridium sp. BL-8 TaxID=349938 RepID=UPI00098C4FBF|nr:hypothetical protein [Clostridium sp. BL-8]OOM68613.1 hypothetical protein CLOBL_53270 [Clostridium sp. BL-8]
MADESIIWQDYCNKINGKYSGRSILNSCTITAKYKNLNLIYNLVPIKKGLYYYFSKASINIDNKGNFKFLFARKTNPGFYLGPYGLPSLIRSFKYDKIKTNTSIDKKYKIKTNNIEIFNKIFSEDGFYILTQLPVFCFEISDKKVYLLVNSDLTDNDDFMIIHKQCCFIVDILKEKEIIV